MRCLAEHALKFAKVQFTALCRLTSGSTRKGAKIKFKDNIKIVFLNRRQPLSKNERALRNRQKFQKCLKFDSGCTVC